MILYEKNPNLKLKVITTVLGDKEYRKNCKFIGLEYHRINRDCFEIDGTYYTIKNGNIFFDYSSNSWKHKSELPKYTKGVVINNKNEVELGYFICNEFKCVDCRYLGNTYKGYDYNKLIEEHFIEDISTGILHFKKELSNSSINSAKSIRSFRMSSPKIYNVEDDKDLFNKTIQNYNNLNFPIGKNIKLFSLLLNNITFGIEYEASMGYINPIVRYQNGLIMCRDGSVAANEYTTIPLQGAKGLQTIVNIEKEMKKRININLDCSLHLHIGSIRKDRLFLIALYMLGKNIQDDIFQMFPYYKTNPEGIKRKNYCKKLKSLNIYPLVNFDPDAYDGWITDNYNRIFNFLAEGKISQSEFNKETRKHPVANKWEIESRKHWMNLMNMFFTHRHTVEFRIHQMTVNATKVINWLFICNALIQYTNLHANEIIKNKTKYSVKEILSVYQGTKTGNELFQYLISYFENRKEVFEKAYKNGDKICDFDLEEDKTFKFPGINWYE